MPCLDRAATPWLEQDRDLIYNSIESVRRGEVITENKIGVLKTQIEQIESQIEQITVSIHEMEMASDEKNSKNRGNYDQ